MKLFIIVGLLLLANSTIAQTIDNTTTVEVIIDKIQLYYSTPSEILAVLNGSSKPTSIIKLSGILTQPNQVTQPNK